MDITDKLMAWYKSNKRDLPWRKTSDPYRIWVSEIILQQTRVDQGMAYYHRFLERFPDINSLAISSEDEVLKIWQGLGYYSRARNMHESAKIITEKHNGRFPEAFSSILDLKGIGEYTASAIASIAFGKPHPVADGNVIRVITRLEGITDPPEKTSVKKAILGKLHEMIDRTTPGDFNQAMMELGALVCTPSNPDCAACPLKNSCKAHAQGLTDVIPNKKKQQEKKIRYFEYFLIFFKEQDEWYTIIEKRTNNDIWKGLYQFPLLEFQQQPEDPVGKYMTDKKHCLCDQDLVSIQSSNTYSHILTHRIIKARFHAISLNSPVDCSFPGIKVPFKNISSYPFPRLTDRYFSEFLKKNEKNFTKKGNKRL